MMRRPEIDKQVFAPVGESAHAQETIADTVTPTETGVVASDHTVRVASTPAPASAAPAPTLAPAPTPTPQPDQADEPEPDPEPTPTPLPTISPKPSPKPLPDPCGDCGALNPDPRTMVMCPLQTDAFYCPL